jgi:hypothetical protein
MQLDLMPAGAGAFCHPFGNFSRLPLCCSVNNQDVQDLPPGDKALALFRLRKAMQQLYESTSLVYLPAQSARFSPLGLAVNEQLVFDVSQSSLWERS